jgi:hypothetical protein
MLAGRKTLDTQTNSLITDLSEDEDMDTYNREAVAYWRNVMIRR